MLIATRAVRHTVPSYSSFFPVLKQPSSTAEVLATLCSIWEQQVINKRYLKSGYSKLLNKIKIQYRDSKRGLGQNACSCKVRKVNMCKIINFDTSSYMSNLLETHFPNMVIYVPTKERSYKSKSQLLAVLNVHKRIEAKCHAVQLQIKKLGPVRCWGSDWFTQTSSRSAI